MEESLEKLSLFCRWRPAVGRIAGRIAVAGGGDWGTDTIEVLDQNRRSVFKKKIVYLILNNYSSLLRPKVG